MARPINPDITALGALCLHGHEYQNTGQSLRYRRNNQCAECHREGHRKYEQGLRDARPEGQVRRTASVMLDIARLEGCLSHQQQVAAKERTAGFLLQCRRFKINVTALERRRAYLEALEEAERNDTDHLLPPPEPQYEQRDYSRAGWGYLDWPT